MKILCLDDEPLALKMLEQAVRQAKPDADITAFRKQAELLEQAKQGGCDIAFLDIHMRGMNGVELAKELKAVNPKMNIIFVTGFSEYAGDAMKLHASGYIMKPVTAEEVAAELSDLRFPIVPKNDVLLRVQCFGNFEVFMPDGEIMKFDRSKSKEIFAYLVHRHGSSCSTKEIAAVLFEDEPYDAKQQNYVQQLIYSMMNSLKNAGVADVIVRSRNSLAVNVKLLDCDYFRFKELDAGAVNSFCNEYMSQYYWADFLHDEDL